MKEPTEHRKPKSEMMNRILPEENSKGLERGERACARVLSLKGEPSMGLRGHPGTVLPHNLVQPQASSGNHAHADSTWRGNAPKRERSRPKRGAQHTAGRRARGAEEPTPDWHPQQ